MCVKCSYLPPLRHDATRPYVPALRRCWSLTSPLEVSGSGGMGPTECYGGTSTSNSAESPVLQSENTCRRWNRLRGRAILFGVCLQSCQFRSPGQKSCYLLKQILCRTKCQADFKAWRCAEPPAAITWQQAPAPSCSSPNPSLRHKLSLLPKLPAAFEDFLMPLYACWPLKRQDVQRCGSQSWKSKPSCLVQLQRHFLLLVYLVKEKYLEGAGTE